MLSALGAVDQAGDAAMQREGIHQHRLEMQRYGLLARHGHEWDPWNFERWQRDGLPSGYSDEDYLYTPIGDPITTELVVRIPFELRQRLLQSPVFRDTEELLNVYRRLQQIEDVRPLLASFQWIFYEARRIGGQLSHDQSRALLEALADTVTTVCTDFMHMPFYRSWHGRHDRFGWPDHADALQYFLEVIQRFQELNLVELGRHFGPAEKLWRWLYPDPHLAGAAREELDSVGARGLRFVVYGHTHEPAQVALRAGAARDVYLNSGTWRERQHITLDRQGFICWQQFSYLVFYDERENPGERREGPAYERWKGTRYR
jgi:hypothetical protein